MASYFSTTACLPILLFYVPASSHIPKFAPSTHSFLSEVDKASASLLSLSGLYIFLVYNVIISFKYIANTNENEKGEEVYIRCML